MIQCLEVRGMGYSDLLDRMMQRDTDAFLEMTERYGWSVYSFIRRQHPDKEIADKIYNHTMNRFYHALQNPDCDDPVEALLCALSQNVSVAPGEQIAAGVVCSPFGTEDQPPRITMISGDVQPAEVPRKKPGLFFTLGLILLILAILTVVWCIVGLLMSMDVIPGFDFGYSWFNSHFFQLF